MTSLVSTSSVKAEEKMLRHLFLSENLSMPKEWYIQLYSDEPKEIQTFNHELDMFKTLAQPIKVKNWNILNSNVQPTTITRASIQNSSLIIFPLVPLNQTWIIKYLGLWAGEPSKSDSYLFYYRVFQDALVLTNGQQYYISPGELNIYYNC